MDIEDRLQGGQFESLPADKGGPGPAKCEPACCPESCQGESLRCRRCCSLHVPALRPLLLHPLPSSAALPA